jgi:hypothetical protein
MASFIFIAFIIMLMTSGVLELSIGMFETRKLNWRIILRGVKNHCHLFTSGYNPTNYVQLQCHEVTY